MKVLHIVAGELSGGAARGAYWLHRGLLDLGVESKILTNSSQTFGDDTVTSTLKGQKSKVASIFLHKLDVLPTVIYKDRKKVIFSTGFVGIDFVKLGEYREADIIHFHWINDGFVNIKHFRKLNKPVVWTMRDMWPMTGGCHYSLDCSNFKNGCGACDQLKSGSKYDLSRVVLARKLKHYQKNMIMVGISNWLSEQARESSVFKDFDVRTIFNNIDTNEFRVIDKGVARGILGIDTSKKLILIGAQKPKDFYKGFDKFEAAAKFLDKDKYMLLFFGNIDASVTEKLNFEYLNFGFISDSVTLRLIYSAADVFVAPSVMDAFGKTLVESMACGTPVVCFNATGPKDIVVHKETGYKAVPFQAEDMARGINWIAEHPDSRILGKASRDRAVSHFDCRVIANQYAELYKEILK